MIRSYKILALAGLFITGSVIAQDGDYNKTPELDRERDLHNFSYALGVQFGQNLKGSGVKEIDRDFLTQAIVDVLEGNDLRIKADQANQVVKVQMQRLNAAYAKENEAIGKKFLELNKSKKGVKVLPSGLQYQVLTEGTGASPGPTDKVTTHYHGTLVDGTIFDSSVDRGTPASFPVNGVIKGWVEALQLMKTGGKWRIFVPPHLGYGSRPAPGGKIPPNSTLIFEIELISIDK